MARPLRIEFPGAFYHVTTRGNARGAIFSSDEDRNQLLFIFGKIADKFNWRCYSYCLMNNHYHLVIQTTDPTLSRGMQHLNGTFTQWFNSKHGRVGHLFQGRFKAFLVEEHEYLLQAMRYVILNPVRAEMVTDPADYHWSSYRATIGLETAPEWLARKEVLKVFSKDRQQAEKQFRRFVQKGMNLPSPFEDSRSGGILGSVQFIDEMRKHMEDKETNKEFVLKQRTKGRPTLEALFDEIKTIEDRNVAITLAVGRLQYSAAEVGRYLHLHASTISKIVNGMDLDSRFKT